MAAIHLIATLMLLQGLIFSHSMADDDMPESGSGSGSEISPSPSQMMGTPSSSIVTRSQGPNVTLTLAVSVDCSGDNLMKLSDSLEDDIEQVYRNELFPIHSVNVMEDCDDDLQLFDAIITLWFYTGIPQDKTIKGVFEEALADGDIANLTQSNTNFNITFAGVTLDFQPKEGQCDAICCEGAGGALTVVQTCEPEDKCEGIELEEKEEEGHCPGEEKATCPDTCDKEEESGSPNNLPTFPVIMLLLLTKIIFC